MRQYNPRSKRDTSMLREWYLDLIQAGDYRQVFCMDANYEQFVKLWLHGELFVVEEEGRFVCTVWLNRMFTGGELGCWVRADRRDRGDLQCQIIDFIGTAVQMLPFVLICTIRTHVIKLAIGLGATPMGFLPGWGDGVQVLKLTQETFTPDVVRRRFEARNEQ
jgi:hypothetical protein